MPDPNGTAVVMKFKNILDLEQYLYSVSMELHTNLFEIVPLKRESILNLEGNEVIQGIVLTYHKMSLSLQHRCRDTPKT